MSANSLFKETLTVVNVGLKGFGDDIVAAGGQCVALDWQPPAQGDREGGWALAEILDHPAVEAANATALARFIAANPVLIDVATARDVLPGMAGGRRLIVHAGPPIAWPRDVRADARRGAGRRACSKAGPSRSRPRERLVAGGGVELEPCHHQAAVGPMAGIISPSHAGLRRREQGRGQSRVLQLQRRARQGAALRRQRAGGHRPLAHDGRRRRADAACGAGAHRPDRAEAADGAGDQHGRRGAQPQRRRDGALHQAHRAGADRGRRDAPGRRGDARLHRRQRPLLPQPVDGRVQGDVRRGGGRRGQLDGDGDGAQRRQLRRPPLGHRRRLVRSAGQSGRRALLSRLFDRRCRGRSRRFGDHRDRRRRRLRDGGGAGDRQVRRRHADRCDPSQPAHARHHARRQSVVHAAGARLRRGRGRHRRAQGGRLRRAAGHQQRHRAPRGRRRPDRRRRHDRADGLLHGGGEGARAQHRRRPGRPT